MMLLPLAYSIKDLFTDLESEQINKSELGYFTSSIALKNISLSLLNTSLLLSRLIG